MLAVEQNVCSLAIDGVGYTNIYFLNKQALSLKSTEEFSKPLVSILKHPKQALKTWLVLAVEQSVCSSAIDGVGCTNIYFLNKQTLRNIQWA